MSTAEQRSRRLDPGPLITLYDLDLTSKGGSVLRYHDMTDAGDRSFKDGHATDNSVQYTSASANFIAADAGKAITGKFIQAGTSIQSVVNESTVNLSSVANGSGTGLPFTIVLRANPVITWKGNPYNPYPIRAEEFEWSTRGTLPRPKLNVGNIESTISALLRQYDDFVGCKLTRTRTFGAFVKIGDVPGEEWDAACTQHFPVETFVVERKTMETAIACSFELSMAMDAEGVLLPRRQILAHTCIWRYRGGDCGYTGVPKTDRLGNNFVLGDSRGQWFAGQTYALHDYVWTPASDDTHVNWVSQIANNIGHNPTAAENLNETYWKQDVCLKKYSDCEKHFGVNNPLRTAAFPACYKVR